MRRLGTLAAIFEVLTLDRLAVRQEGPSRLSVFEVSTGALQPMYQTPTVDRIVDVTWMADAHSMLLFLRPVSAPRQSGTEALYRIRVDAGTPQKLLALFGANPQEPLAARAAGQSPDPLHQRRTASGTLVALRTTNRSLRRISRLYIPATEIHFAQQFWRAIHLDLCSLKARFTNHKKGDLK
jgi:hypothetical protein